MTLDKSKFQKPPPGPPPSAAAGGYNWGGMKNFGAKDPIPPIGTVARVRVESVVRGFNPGSKETSAKISLRVISGNVPAGSGLFVPFMIGAETAEGFAYEYARARFGAFVAGAGGFDTVAALLEFDPAGESITGLLKGSGVLDNRVVDLAVVAGKAFKDGSGNFNEYVWTPVPDTDDAQDQTPSLAAQRG
jgi:hypothetical protein